MSADGSVVVGAGLFPGGPANWTAFRWTAASGAVDLGDPPGVFSGVANGVSSDGAVIVGSWSYPPGPGEQPTRAYRWTSSTGKVELGAMPGGSWNVAEDVSGDGSVIVGFGDSSSGASAYRWTQSGGFEIIAQGWARDVSSDGSTVVGTALVNQDLRQAFRWTEVGGVELLGSLAPGEYSYGVGVSENGSYVVGTGMIKDGYEAFRWSESEGMVGLGNLAGLEESTAWAVSADGATIVGSFDYGVGAFIWTPESGMRRLIDVLVEEYGLADQLAGWDLRAAYGMSADGRYIVGAGLHESRNGAWLLDRGLNPPPIHPEPLRPVPEPATYGLLGAVGLLGVVMWRKLLRRAGGISLGEVGG